MAKYANVIVDISHEKLDKTFQYGIPDDIASEIQVGVQVDIPFGSRTISGYVVEITDIPEYDVSKIKPLIGVKAGSVAMESRLIRLACWIKKNYGSTMNQALKTVIPIKKKTKEIRKRTIHLIADDSEARDKLALYEAKHQTARARLLRELITEREIDYSVVTAKLNVSSTVIKALCDQNIVTVTDEKSYRNPVKHLERRSYDIVLTENQQMLVDEITGELDKGEHHPYLF